MQGPGGQYQATSDYKVQPTTIPKALPSILGKEGASLGGPTQVPKHMQQQQNFLLKASGQQALSKNGSMNGSTMSMSGQVYTDTYIHPYPLTYPFPLHHIRQRDESFLQYS